MGVHAGTHEKALVKIDTDRGVALGKGQAGSTSKKYKTEIEEFGGMQ